MFSIVTSPQDHKDYPAQVKLLNTLRSSRQVSVRDLVKWCTRAQETFKNNPTSQQLAEIPYQNAVDICCRFIPDRNIRTFIAQEIAFTLNSSKDQAAFSPPSTSQPYPSSHPLPHPSPLSTLCSP